MNHSDFLLGFFVGVFAGMVTGMVCTAIIAWWYVHRILRAGITRWVNRLHNQLVKME